jgi:hypothetical protein
LPDYNVPAPWREPGSVPADAAPEMEAAAAPVPTSGPVPAPQETQRPRLIPVFQEPEAQQHDFLPTAAAPLGDIDIPREPQLQETAEETTRNTIADAREPGLMPTLHQPEGKHVEKREVAEFAPGPEMPAVNIAPEMPLAPPVAPVAEAAAAPSASPETAPEMDFESRVAAAMAAYNHPPETSIPTPVTDITPPAAPAAAAAVVPVPIKTERAVATPAEYHSPANAEANHHEAAAIARVAEPAAGTSRPAEPEVRHEDVTARVAAELPAAAAAAAAKTGAAEDHETIAQAVHRVMDRVKGDLVEEILRELKSKK